MTGYRMPVFSKGNLLTQDMLETMKNYEIQYAQNSYTGYSDGIITGLKVHVEKGMVYIGQGIIKYEGRLFFIPDNTKVIIQPIDVWQVVKIAFGDFEVTNTCAKQEMSIEISQEISPEASKIEVCRVRLQDGARLRSDYRNLEDMSTEFDTINIIESQWAAYEKESINPQILKEFAKEAVKYTLSNPQDMLFIQQILNQNGQALNREVIEFYLDSRLEKTKSEYKNHEIYQGLCQVLKQIKTGIVQKSEVKKPRRLIVD